MEDASLVQFGPYSLRPESPTVIFDRDNLSHNGCRLWLEFAYTKKDSLGLGNAHMLERELYFLHNGVAAHCPACVLILDALTAFTGTEDKLQDVHITATAIYTGPLLNIQIGFGGTKLEVFHAKGV